MTISGACEFLALLERTDRTGARLPATFLMRRIYALLKRHIYRPQNAPDVTLSLVRRAARPDDQGVVWTRKKCRRGTATGVQSGRLRRSSPRDRRSRPTAVPATHTITIINWRSRGTKN